SSAGSILVSARHNQGGQRATATSNAASGGVISGVGTRSTATANANVQTYADSNVTLAAQRDVSFVTYADNSATSTSSGKSGGVVSAGEVNASATSQGTTLSELRSIQRLTAGGSVSIFAKGTNDTIGNASAASGGVVNLAGSNASAISAPQVTARAA